MAQRLNLESVEAVYNGAPEDRTELGLLIWYTVFDQPVARPTLEEAFQKAGVDSKWLPQPIQSQDVFRRMTSLRRKKLPQEDSQEIFANYYVTEVSSTKDTIVRVLVKDTVDAGNIRLSHENVGSFTLDRAEKTVTFQQYENIDADLAEYIDDLTTNFEDYCKFYNGKILREIVRAILYSMQTVSLKDHGGVYFVPRQHKELLYKVQRMVAILQEKQPDSSKQSSVKAVTLMNKAQERLIIKETVEDHIQEKLGGIQGFVSDMAEVLRNQGTVRQKDVESYLKQAKELAMTVKDYEGLLEEELVGLRAGVDVMKQQLGAMLSKVSE